MMWADRAGVGLWAIAMLGVVLLLFTGTLGPWRTPEPNPFDQFDAKPAMALPAGQRVYSDREMGIEPPPTAPERAAEIAAKVAAFGVFPAWFVLRVGDWVFGGPTRRRRQRAGASRS